MAVYKKMHMRRKPMADINIVPYIDVMLVLLIIFMITAPLLTQRVNVDLPQAVANPVETPDNAEPLIVSVDANGNYYASIGETPDQPVEPTLLANRVAAVIRNNPQVPVMVKGDASANYGQVVGLMALLQQAGVPNVGLITKQPESQPAN
jgi:biopolymer transport protein TolR